MAANTDGKAVLVVGVEKMTDRMPYEVTAALATAAHVDTEAVHGVTFAALNALLMRLYMEKYRVPEDSFAGFSLKAHANAIRNPFAMFRNPLSPEDYASSEMVASPVRLMDCAPVCDGAAAVVLCERNAARRFAKQSIRVLSSGCANDQSTLASRREPLNLAAAKKSAANALAAAALGLQDIDVFELHDAFTILTALSLEALGVAAEGEGWKCGVGEKRMPPCSTLGGLKARGHPVGASGLYQVVDACTQLRGVAGEAQVDGAEVALTQSFGGLAASVVTHVLAKED
jgi:acetyl-CoA C-acetyltransferase